MSNITIDIIEKNFGEILDQVGFDSYVPWEQFTKNSTKVVNAIDGLTKALAIFRQMQHKKFIQTMKKLKSLDVPDTIESVRNKKLPKQVLKPILSRFKMNEGKIQLVQSKQNLKAQALKQYEAFKVQNEQLVSQVDKYIQYFTAKAIQSGYEEPLPLPELRVLKSTVQFKFDANQIKNISKQIKVTHLPLTKLLSIQSYTQLVQKSFDVIEQNYIDLTLNARKEQRKNKGNSQKYFKIMNDYLNNAEALIIQGQKRLYENLDLGQKQLDLNQHSLMERGFGQQMMMCQGQIRSKLKQSIKSTKEVESSKVIQIIQFQIKMIKQKGSEIKKIFGGLQKTIQSAQIIPILLSLVLNDYIFDAYGFQEEDFMKNVNGMQIYNNPMLAETFREMEMAVMSLMQSLEIIPKDISQMMMGGGFDMNAMMAEMSGNMGGNNSSTNPMQILQAQQEQMQKMQQMFKNMQNNSKEGFK